MRRNLLNIIFRKYPLLGNFGELIELDVKSLTKLAETDNIEEARELFKNILENNNNSNIKEKKLVNGSSGIYYVNY